MQLQIIATVDAVILTIDDGALKVVLHHRPNDPFQGMTALPGGYIRVEDDKNAEDAIRRVLSDKAGLSGFYLEQLATYSGPDRDPRGWSMSVAYLALVPADRLMMDKSKAALFPINDLPELPFDHGQIIHDAVERLRGKGAYSTLPASLLGKTFTLSEMHAAYEVALGMQIDASSFRRKVLALSILKECAEMRQDGNKRPAKTYALKKGVTTFNRTLGAT